MPARGRPRPRDQGGDPQGQRQRLLRRPRGAVGSRRESVPGLRGHVRGSLQGHRRPVLMADVVSVGVPEADDLADPRLLHGWWHLSWPADRLLRGIRGRLFSDAVGAEPRRARRPHHDRAVAADELASHHGLAVVGADAVCAGSPRLGATQQGGAARGSRGCRRGDGTQDRPDPVDHVDGGEEQREAGLGIDGNASAPSGQPHLDQHGRRGFRRSGTTGRTHAIRFEAEGFRRPRRTRIGPPA